MTVGLILMEESAHIGEDQLERYSVGTLPENAVARVEEHVLLCETCQDKLASIDSWVRSVRRTGVHWLPEQRGFSRLRQLPRLVTALAAMFVLLLAAGAVLRLNQRGAVAPLAVALEATRGENVARVPARQPLLIQPGLVGLPQFPAYRLEIVDQLGKRVFQTTFAPAQGASPRVSGLAEGVYFARLYSPPGDLLREYALSVGQVPGLPAN
jgi:hypothetical protein